MKRVPPQSLTWRVDVEPYPAISPQRSNCQDLWIGVSCDVLLAS